jgi:hypothetical protein
MEIQSSIQSAKNSAMGFLRRLFYGLIVLCLLAVGLTFLAFNASYSEGDRAGTVSKFSKKGYLFKTYEGELNVGGFSGETGNLTPQIWSFSVEASDEGTARKLEDAMTSGKRVKLHYEEKYFGLPWKGESKYFVTDIKFAN